MGETLTRKWAVTLDHRVHVFQYSSHESTCTSTNEYLCLKWGSAMASVKLLTIWCVPPGVVGTLSPEKKPPVAESTLEE